SSIAIELAHRRARRRWTWPGARRRRPCRRSQRYSLRRSREWPEGGVEQVVGDLAPHRDSLGFRKVPVNAQINTALAVLVFGLRQRREAARNQRTEVACMIDS